MDSSSQISDLDLSNKTVQSTLKALIQLFTLHLWVLGEMGTKEDLLGLAVGGQCNHWACLRRNGSARSRHTPDPCQHLDTLVFQLNSMDLAPMSLPTFQSSHPQWTLKFSWSIHPSLCLKAGWSQTPFFTILKRRFSSLDDATFFFMSVLYFQNISHKLFDLHPSEADGYVFSAFVSVSFSHTLTLT